MPWRGAAYPGEFPSLGWQLLDWIEARFVVPDGQLAGEALRFTDDQAARLVRWYALDDRGRFLFRRGAKRGPKGEGKSPEAAVYAIAELCGPTTFDGWDAAGEPVGVPRWAPLVQVAAVSEDQTANTYGWIYELLRDAPVVDEERLDVGLTRVFTTGRPGILEPVTAAAGTREGQRLTFGVLDETHLWLPSNGGVKLAATMRRNAGKMGGRTWETTNAYVVGQHSVAESTHDAAKRAAAGLLYECREPSGDVDLHDDESLRRGLAEAYGDSLAWVDVDRLVAEVRDPSTTAQDARRFYLNIPVVEDLESWLKDYPGAWERCAVELDLADCTEVVGAIDMSLRHDTTAVVWVGKHPSGRIAATGQVFRAPVGGKVDFVAVDETIRAGAVQYGARAICYDPRFLEFHAARLSDESIPMLEFPQSPERMIPACGRLFELIVGGELAHDGNPDLGAHVAAAIRRESERGWTLSKGRSKAPIDACVALAMAVWELAQQPAAETTVELFV